MKNRATKTKNRRKRVYTDAEKRQRRDNWLINRQYQSIMSTEKKYL